MTREEFRKLCLSRPVILDGATGSNLQACGMPSGGCNEQWILEHPEPLLTLQHAYVEVGSDILYAPTFLANRKKLGEHGLSDQVSAMNQQLVALSRQAAGSHTLVAGELSMTGQQLAPLGELSLEEAVEVYREQVQALLDASVDLLVVETMLSLQETRAALIAIRELCDLPVLVSMTFSETGKTVYGADLIAAAQTIQGLGADAFGINCSPEPAHMLPLLQRVKPYLSIPLLAKPNAGLPHHSKDGRTVYDMDVDTYAGYMRELLAAGANLVGGCCGTNPDYLRCIVREAHLSAQSSAPSFIASAEELPVITSERELLSVAHPISDTSLGSLLCSRQNAEFASILENEDWDSILDLIDEMEDDAPDALLIEADRIPKPTASNIAKLLTTITAYTSLPLVFQSSNPQILEAELRCYSGVAGVLMASTEAEAAMLPLSSRYGAAPVTLQSPR